jgi:hypothetical protein
MQSITTFNVRRTSKRTWFPIVLLPFSSEFDGTASPKDCSHQYAEWVAGLSAYNRHNVLMNSLLKMWHYDGMKKNIMADVIVL